MLPKQGRVFGRAAPRSFSVSGPQLHGPSKWRTFTLAVQQRISRSPGVNMVGDSNDRSSICDEFINPLYAALSQCTVPNRGEGDSWTVPFDGTGGAFGSLFAGYRFSPLLRAELEYILRVSNYGERSPVTTAQGVNADKLSDELFLADEWLRTVSMFGLFANVHFDLYMIKGPI